MVYDFEKQLDSVFHALSDKTRRSILERLAENELGIAELASTYAMSLVAVSKHIKVLEKAGLVITTKAGRVTRCAMRFEPLEPASQQIELYKQFWRDQVSEMDMIVQRVKRRQQQRKSATHNKRPERK